MTTTKVINKKKQINFDEELLVIFYSILSYMKKAFGFEVNTEFVLRAGDFFAGAPVPDFVVFASGFTGMVFVMVSELASSFSFALLTDDEKRRFYLDDSD